MGYVALIHSFFYSAHPFLRTPDKVGSIAADGSSAGTVQEGQIGPGRAIRWKWEIGHYTGCVGLWRTEGEH